MCYVHPGSLGKWSHLSTNFWNGLVQPPTFVHSDQCKFRSTMTQPPIFSAYGSAGQWYQRCVECQRCNVRFLLLGSINRSNPGIEIHPPSTVGNLRSLFDSNINTYCWSKYKHLKSLCFCCSDVIVIDMSYMFMTYLKSIYVACFFTLITASYITGIKFGMLLWELSLRWKIPFE